MITTYCIYCIFLKSKKGGNSLKKIFFMLVFIMCISIFEGAFATETNEEIQLISEEINIPRNNLVCSTKQSVKALEKSIRSYLNIDENKFCQYNEKQKDIELPWINNANSILDWTVKLNYNGNVFEQVVPVDITDFQKKFLDLRYTVKFCKFFFTLIS